MNLWINELVWRVNGDGEFVEIAGPLGVDSSGWLVTECDEGEGSEFPDADCRGGLLASDATGFMRIQQPVPPLRPSGGLAIATLDVDVQAGTDR